ncbi:unnamed protein product [Caenorhabditis auriculariae]|uniref:Uncharacterized protein n=1 Tax=Caenorhabditis auriculariae TaxID=2777116 RepID=A0A8S1HEW0_9PELO|nr:unnamed protein product [Caenorhabditis auriculariae]
MATSYRMTTTTTTTSSRSQHGAELIGREATAFVEATEREKKDLQELNSRLEIYIGRVKQLEIANRDLVQELDELRSRLGGEVGQVKYKFSDSLKTARSKIADAHQGTVAIEVKANRLRQDVVDYRNRYEDALREANRERATWGASIHSATAELERSKSMYASILDEEKRLYAEQEHLYRELDTVKDELDAAISERLVLQHQEENLKAELEFLNRVHVQEISELRGLLSQAPADTRDFFKNELALAIREIKAEYEKIVHTTRTDLETVFESRVVAAEAAAAARSEVSVQRQAEISKMSESIASLRSKFTDLEAKNVALEREAYALQNQIREDKRQYEEELSKRDAALVFMREDCQKLVIELQALLNTKQTLDTEIAIYRKLVESEEHRVGQYVVAEKESVFSGEVSTRSTFQRHAKGNVSIVECEPTGKYIILENTSSRENEDIGEYQIKRTIDGRHAFTYTLPAHTNLRAGGHLKIYARNGGGIHSPPESIIFEGEPSWGQGASVQTILYNRSHVERASHIQKTVSQ